MKTKRRLARTARLGLLAVFILLQAAILVGIFLLFRRAFTWFYAACEVISLIAVLYILRQDTNPAYKIPWIILILLLPIAGGPAYLMFGRVHLLPEEKRRALHLLEDSDCVLNSGPDVLETVPASVRRQAAYLSIAADAPVYSNTQVRYLPTGEVFFEQMLSALSQARHFIFLEYYIIRPGRIWDQIHDILRRKAAEGVDVRLMYDDIGCLGMPREFGRQLRQEGISCCAFNRLTNIFSSRFNNRDHRKICVVDGNVGFTGGINLADEYANLYERFGYWKDTGVMLRGEAVRSLTVAFLFMWGIGHRTQENFSKFLPTVQEPAPGFVQPFVDAPQDGEYVGQTAYCNMLGQAERYVYISTPYLIPDYVMISALTAAAKSGVDVRIITPGIPDKPLVYRLTRSYYSVLQQAGVRIYEYEPGFIHAKQFLCDDRCAIVGTINLDYRSLCHHFECAVWMCDVPAVADIRADFDELFAHSREVTTAEARTYSTRWRLLLALLRIFSPMF